MSGQRDELIITRVFDAPRKLVWEAWSKPEQVKRWWGPKIFTCPSADIDFRVGGKYLFCMRSHSGPETWQKGIWSTGAYKEIKPPEKIVFTDSFADEHGNIVPATYYGMEGFELELEVALTFEEIAGGKTKITLRHKGLPENIKQECRDGWNESFDKLDMILGGKAGAIPEGYHSVTPNLIIRGAAKAIEFYKQAFGAELTFRQDRPDGKLMHATIKIGDSILMLADECAPHKGHDAECVRSPDGLGGTTTNFYLYVNDADAVFNKAIKSGAVVAVPVADMFWGDRLGMLKDPFGHFWTVATHTKDVSPEQLKRGSEEFLHKEQETARGGGSKK